MPRLLDLFCCQGGASQGYVDAGFEVVGVDIDPQPRYPFEFIQADATTLDPRWIADNFDAVHASPPCQAHTRAWKLNKREHPRLIPPTRALLESTGLPYVIENVEEAREELIAPALLCGAMFGLHTYRHRLFEFRGFTFETLVHPKHQARTAKMGRPVAPGEYMHIVGNFSGVDRARDIMAMPWANRDGLREAIPPAYTEHIGRGILLSLAVGAKPSDPSRDSCPEWNCPDLSTEARREGKTCPDHPCTCRANSAPGHASEARVFPLHRSSITMRFIPRKEQENDHMAETIAHDSRCISLTDGEFNRHCDCEILGTLDGGSSDHAYEPDDEGNCWECGEHREAHKPSDPSTKEKDHD